MLHSLASHPGLTDLQSRLLQFRPCSETAGAQVSLAPLGSQCLPGGPPGSPGCSVGSPVGNPEGFCWSVWSAGTAARLMLLLWRRPHAATTNQCHWTISLGPACHHSLTICLQLAMKSSMMLLQHGDTMITCTKSMPFGTTKASCISLVQHPTFPNARSGVECQH